MMLWDQSQHYEACQKIHPLERGCFCVAEAYCCRCSSGTIRTTSSGVSSRRIRQSRYCCSSVALIKRDDAIAMAYDIVAQNVGRIGRPVGALGISVTASSLTAGTTNTSTRLRRNISSEVCSPLVCRTNPFIKMRQKPPVACPWG